MAWWLIFIALHLLFALLVWLFVPSITRGRYGQCRAPVFWLANALSHSVWIVAAIQACLAPTSLAAWTQVIGFWLIVAGRALLVWAMRVNPWFTPMVVRPAWIATAGPYRWLSHPGYVGLALSHVGTFLLLAQIWAMIPLIPYLALLAWRARVESRLLASLRKS